MRVQGFYPSKKFSAQVQTLRKFIHEALGWDYAPDVTAPEILMPLRAVGILTSLSGRLQFCGRLIGQAFRNQNFELVDVTAVPKRRIINLLLPTPTHCFTESSGPDFRELSSV